jgi:hypothetical protein
MSPRFRVVRTHVCLVAAVLIFISTPTLFAFVTRPDLPGMAQRAKCFVRVKVLKLETRKCKVTERGKLSGVSDAEREVKVATLQLQKSLFGDCGAQIEVVYGDSVQYRQDETFAVGEECYLALQDHLYCEGMLFEMCYGHGKMAIENGVVKIPDALVPDGLKHRANNLTEEKFAGFIQWLRGPTMTITPTENEFSRGKPLEIKVVLTNETADSMVVPIAAEAGFGGWCHFMLRDAAGKPVVSSATDSGPIWAGRTNFTFEYDPESRRAFEGNARFNTEVMKTKLLKPGDSFSFRLKLYVSEAEFVQNPKKAETLTLQCENEPLRKDPRWSQMWLGSLSTACKIRYKP